ncbi:hypothetical protein E4U54_005414, partial [Claviceps lovelessii]
MVPAVLGSQVSVVRRPHSFLRHSFLRHVSLQLPVREVLEVLVFLCSKTPSPPAAHASQPQGPISRTVWLTGVDDQSWGTNGCRGSVQS